MITVRNYHDKIMQGYAGNSWPYHHVLRQYKRGKLAIYQKESVLKRVYSDGKEGPSGPRIPKNTIVMITKEPYEHHNGGLICVQILWNTKIYRDYYMSAKEFFKHLKPVGENHA